MLFSLAYPFIVDEKNNTKFCSFFKLLYLSYLTLDCLYPAYNNTALQKCISEVIEWPIPKINELGLTFSVAYFLRAYVHKIYVCK